MKRLLVYSLLLALSVMAFACKQAQDIKAFTEATYSLQGVHGVALNGIDVHERIQARHGFTYEERDSLLTAITSNTLHISSTMALHVALPDQTEERTLTITKLKWLLSVDGEEALTGTVDKMIVLKDGLNMIPFETPVLLTEDDGQPNYTGLSRLITLIGQRGDIRQHVSFRIKPTIQTPVGNIESPKFITVLKTEELVVL